MREAETIYWPTRKNNNIHSKDENHIFLISPCPSIYPLSSIDCLQKNSTLLLSLFFFFKTFWQSRTAIWQPGKFASPSRAYAQKRGAPWIAAPIIECNEKKNDATKERQAARRPPRSVSPGGRPPLTTQRMTRHYTSRPPTWRGILKKKISKKQTASSNSILA